MFKATRPFKDSITGYKFEPSLRIGRRVPKNAVNLAYYYNPTATDSEKVMAAEAPRPTIDHRVETAYRYLFDVAGEDSSKKPSDDMFPGYVQYTDEEGYSGKLNRKRVEWYPENHVKTKNVSYKREEIIDVKGKEEKAVEYSDEDGYSGTMYLDSVEYDVYAKQEIEDVLELEYSVNGFELNYHEITGKYIIPGDLDYWCRQPSNGNNNTWPAVLVVTPTDIVGASNGDMVGESLLGNNLNIDYRIIQYLLNQKNEFGTIDENFIGSNYEITNASRPTGILTFDSLEYFPVGYYIETKDGTEVKTDNDGKMTGLIPLNGRIVSPSFQYSGDAESIEHAKALIDKFKCSYYNADSGKTEYKNAFEAHYSHDSGNYNVDDYNSDSWGSEIRQWLSLATSNSAYGFDSFAIQEIEEAVNAGGDTKYDRDIVIVIQSIRFVLENQPFLAGEPEEGDIQPIGVEDGTGLINPRWWAGGTGKAHFECEYMYEITDRGREGILKYDVCVNYSGVLTRKLTTKKTLPSQYLATCIYKGLARKVWTTWDGKAVYIGSVTKGNSVGNLNPDNDIEVLMFPDENGMLRQIVKAYDEESGKVKLRNYYRIEADYVWITNVFKDNIPCFYKYRLKDTIYDYRGPDVNGFYDGNAVKIFTSALKEIPDSYKYNIKLEPAEYEIITDYDAKGNEINIRKPKRYYADLYTSFVSSTTDNYKAVYNAFNESEDTEIDIKNGVTEPIYNAPFTKKGIDYTLVNVNQKTRVNQIKIENYTPIEDTRRYISVKYTVTAECKKRNKKFTSTPRSCRILNKEYAFPCEYDNFSDRAYIVSPDLNGDGTLASPRDIIFKDQAIASENDDKFDIVIYDSDDDFIYYTTLLGASLDVFANKQTFFHNGKTYKIVLKDCTFEEAKDAATALGGHLAMPKTMDEVAFITNVATSVNFTIQGEAVEHALWIGGSSKNDTNSWKWLDNDNIVDGNWSDGQPSNTNGNENSLSIYIENGKWNDLPERDVLKGYIVEFYTTIEEEALALSDGVINLFCNPDGSGYVLAETTVNTGFYNTETGKYDLMFSMDCPYYAENGYIHPGYMIRCIDSRYIKVQKPREDNLLDSWYPLIQFGHYSRILDQYGTHTKVSYAMSEFDKQHYSPIYGKPIVDVKDEKVEIINPHMVKTKCFPLYLYEPNKGKDVFYFNDKIYQVIKGSKTWVQAKADCINRGGHLAMPKTIDEVNFIQKIALENSLNGLWLGATDEESEGTWKWIDGTVVEFTNWAPNEPNNTNGKEHYLETNTNINAGMWNDLENTASGVNGYICEYDKFNISLYKKVGDELFKINVDNVSFSDGIIITKETVSENDNIYCSYHYLEENIVYRGYWRDKGDFVRIDLNPNIYHTYNEPSYIPSEIKPSKNLFNKVIYFFLRPSIIYEIPSDNDLLFYNVNTIVTVPVDKTRIISKVRKVIKEEEKYYWCEENINKLETKDLPFSSTGFKYIMYFVAAEDYVGPFSVTMNTGHWYGFRIYESDNEVDISSFNTSTIEDIIYDDTNTDIPFTVIAENIADGNAHHDNGGRRPLTITINNVTFRKGHLYKIQTKECAGGGTSQGLFQYTYELIDMPIQIRKSYTGYYIAEELYDLEEHYTEYVDEIVDEENLFKLVKKKKQVLVGYTDPEFVEDIVEKVLVHNEHWEEVIPPDFSGLSEEELADMNANPVSMIYQNDGFGYFNYDFRKTFGGNEIMTTYNNGGFISYIKYGSVDDTVLTDGKMITNNPWIDYDNVKVKISHTQINAGLIQVRYDITNESQTTITDVVVGAGADIKIGTDDRATVDPIESGGNIIGIKMVSTKNADKDSNGNYPGFAFVAPGFDIGYGVYVPCKVKENILGIKDVTDPEIRFYGQLTDTDSGLCFNKKLGSINTGETKTIYCYFGIYSSNIDYNIQVIPHDEPEYEEIHHEVWKQPEPIYEEIEIYEKEYQSTTVLKENEVTLYHKIDDEKPNDDEDLLIGSVFIRQDTSLASTVIVDSRTRGGGVLESIEDAVRHALEPESDFYLDIGYNDGEPYQENGVIIIRLDNSLLEEYGGKFTRGDIETRIKRWLGFGIYPIIEFVDTYSKYELPQYTLEVEEEYTNVSNYTIELIVECFDVG